MNRMTVYIIDKLPNVNLHAVNTISCNYYISSYNNYREMIIVAKIIMVLRLPKMASSYIYIY